MTGVQSESCPVGGPPDGSEPAFVSHWTDVSRETPLEKAGRRPYRAVIRRMFHVKHEEDNRNTLNYIYVVYPMRWTARWRPEGRLQGMEVSKNRFRPSTAASPVAAPKPGTAITTAGDRVSLRMAVA